jgi:hypothetical protein
MVTVPVMVPFRLVQVMLLLAKAGAELTTPTAATDAGMESATATAAPVSRRRMNPPCGHCPGDVPLLRAR